MTSVSLFFFLPYDEVFHQKKTRKMRAEASDNVRGQKITVSIMFKPSCAPLAPFDVSFKQRDRNPPQNKGTQHFPYKCGVERTLKPK